MKRILKTGTNEFLVLTNQYLYNYTLEKRNGIMEDWSFPSYGSDTKNMNAIGQYQEGII